MFRITVLLATFITLTISTIVITSPLQTGFPDNEIDYIYGNFGEVPYGKTLSFDLQILNESLCQAQELQHFTKPTYVVIKVGMNYDCTFTKRALKAQASGAKGIIMATSGFEYAQGSVMQADDGNGRQVHITSLFISNSAYDKLKELKNVQIIAKFPVPKEKKSTVSIFLSSSKRSSYVFLRQFQQEYNFLKDYITLDPVFHTIQCEGCSSQNCLMSKYCTFDYENYRYDVGQKILVQQLHQYTIFNVRGPAKWFQYMNLFDDYCVSDWQNVDSCVKKILIKMNMADTYIPNAEQTLNLWKIKEIKLGFDSFPQIAINNMIYTGNFETDQIIEAICQSLEQPPRYCIDGSRGESEIDQTSQTNMSIILVVTAISIVFLAIIGVCIYRKFIKRELTNDMVSRVGELVAHYANKVSKQKIRQKEKFIEAHDEQL